MHLGGVSGQEAVGIMPQACSMSRKAAAARALMHHGWNQKLLQLLLVMGIVLAYLRLVATTGVH